MTLSPNVTGREFQRDGPATEKLLSPRHIRVLFVATFTYLLIENASATWHQHWNKNEYRVHLNF